MEGRKGDMIKKKVLEPVDGVYEPLPQHRARFIHLNHILSGRRKCVAHFFCFPRGGGPTVDIILPSLFVRPPASPFARRGAEPHHHHNQRSRCLCVSALAVGTRVPCYPTTMNSDINMYLGREKAGIMRKRALLLRKGCSFEIT
ncbi:hypothetical protein QQF64_027876, partial [Cirrhinus molitorella]